MKPGAAMTDSMNDDKTNRSAIQEACCMDSRRPEQPYQRIRFHCHATTTNLKPHDPTTATRTTSPTNLIECDMTHLQEPRILRCIH